VQCFWLIFTRYSKFCYLTKASSVLPLFYLPEWLPLPQPGLIAFSLSSLCQFSSHRGLVKPNPGSTTSLFATFPDSDDGLDGPSWFAGPSIFPLMVSHSQYSTYSGHLPVPSVWYPVQYLLPTSRLYFLWIWEAQALASVKSPLTSPFLISL
jgi:hypothetical protein